MQAKRRQVRKSNNTVTEKKKERNKERQTEGQSMEAGTALADNVTRVPAIH